MPLLVLEGADGCGKTTQAGRLETRLLAAGRPVRRLREPGGTVLGEAVRGLLLDPATAACPAAELFGYQLARAQLCHEVIAPALAAGTWVVLDRFWHSTLAYQAYGLGLDLANVRAVVDLAVGPVRPDLALWLDVPPDQAAARADARSTRDRIEARDAAYHQRVYDGYRNMAIQGDLMRIDGLGSTDEVAARIDSAVAALQR